MKKTILALTSIAVVLAVYSPIWANLIVDPSFENDGVNWALSTNSAVVSNGDPRMAGKSAIDGTKVAAVYYAKGGPSGYVFQDFSVLGLSNGTVIQFKYNLAVGLKTAGDPVVAIWVQTLDNFGNINPGSAQWLFQRYINPAGGWYNQDDPIGKNPTANNQYTVTNIGTAPGQTARVRFEVRPWGLGSGVPGDYAYVLADNIVAVPEPTIFTLLTVGGLLVFKQR